MNQCSKHEVLGVGISVLNLDLASEAVCRAVEAKEKGYVCVTGVHGVMESQGNPDFRDILNRAFLNTPDGMPMVWLGKLKGHKAIDRVYGPDLMLRICGDGVFRNISHYFFGGNTGVAELLASRLKERFPGLNVAGTYCPPFRPLNEEERNALIEVIREKKPDCFWVGLSTPKQERFMKEFLPILDTTLMFGVGAAFDFHAGLVKQAPTWIQRSGFEWLFRTVMEPRRLWKRYLVNNSRFAYSLTRNLIFRSTSSEVTSK